MKTPTTVIFCLWYLCATTIVETAARPQIDFEKEKDSTSADFNSPDDLDSFGIGGGEEDDDENVEVLVRYKTNKGKQHAERTAKTKKAKKDLKRFHTVTIATKRSKIKELEDDPDIEAVSQEQEVYALGGTRGGTAMDKAQEIHRQLRETSPWGIDAVQANQLAQGDAAVPFICVIDTGYGEGHPDLPTENAHGVDGYSWYYSEGGDRGEVWDVDGHGHGTHCAGTIGAIGGNNRGVTSVNPNPTKFRFWIGKGLTDSGSGSTTAILAALEECITAGEAHGGPIVVSMSYGCDNCYNRLTEKAYEDAYNAGALLVAAAGNSGNSAKSYPASYKSVMSVAAVDSNLNRAYFSQYNNQVEIAGPGVSVRSTRTTRSGTSFSYVSWSGTSMATPHVAGVAALLWSHFPQCTNHQLRNVLLMSANDKGAEGCDTQYGYGVVQARDAYDLIQNANGNCEAVGGSTPNEPSDAAVGGCNQLDVTTAAPVPAPTAAPVPAPTQAPVPAPTEAPVAASGCPGCSGTCIQLSIMTDSNPQQTRYRLRDQSARKWLIRSSYGDFSSPNTLYTENLCYPDSCFKFIIQDSARNGFQNGGYYSLVVNGETLVDQESDFRMKDRTMIGC